MQYTCDMCHIIAYITITIVYNLKLILFRESCRLDRIYKWYMCRMYVPIKISMKFVPKGSINIIPALFQIMTWRRPGDKPLSEPMVISLPTHICVTRPQWVKMSICIVFKHTLEINIHQCFTFDTPVSMKWRYVVFYDVSDVPRNVILPTYCHMMTSWQTLSALLALCAWNPPITDRFPPQRTSNVEFWRFICR